MRVCHTETRGCTNTRCCKERALPERTSRRGPPSTPPPRYAQLSFVAARPSMLARAGADRRP
eukprot:15476007-Alexandrium_andersonii.AAC.1